MPATLCSDKPVCAYSHYHVEFYNLDGQWATKRFDGPNGFANAKAWYDKCGTADFLGLVKYDGYYFISSK